MQEPQTRITPPLRRTPPGQQRGQPPSSSRGQIRSSVSMSSQPVSTPQTTTPVPDISPKPGASGTSSWSPPDEIKPRLLPERSPRRSSANAAPGRFDAYPRRADVGGPAILHLSHSTAFRNRFLHQPPFAFVTHGSPGSHAWRFPYVHRFSDPAGSARRLAKTPPRDVAFRFVMTASAPRNRVFRGSIARPARTPVNASPRPHERQRMTQGHRESLLPSTWDSHPLSPCRFSGAPTDPPYGRRGNGARRACRAIPMPRTRSSADRPGGHSLVAIAIVRCPPARGEKESSRWPTPRDRIPSNAIVRRRLLGRLLLGGSERAI